MRNLFQKKIYTAFILLFIVFIVGIVGFRMISNYSWVDAFYMTVITITTVGFGEVQPLDPKGKIFTSLLILSSIFIVGYAISIITEYLLSKNNIGNLRQKKMNKQIKKLKNHTIVCGFGRNGKQAAHKLLAYNQPFVIIEKNDNVIEHCNVEEFLFISGNANDDEVLMQAGIDKAYTIICALPNDADNLFIVLSARQMSKDLKIISRATEETSLKKLKLAGADNVILPEKIGGDHMASLVVTPDLIEFLDNLTVSGGDDSMNVEQLPFKKLCKDEIERPIFELDIRKKTGCSIIGYKTESGEYIVNPEPSTIIRKNSILILIGRPQQIEKLKKIYHV